MNEVRNLGKNLPKIESTVSTKTKQRIKLRNQYRVDVIYMNLPEKLERFNQTDTT